MNSGIIGLIPARSGSLRVPNKNILLVNNHPIIAYSIQTAINSSMFEKIIVASDSIEICKIADYYGVSETIQRDSSDSTSTSLDISWLTNLYDKGKINSEYFAILRPTSPLRSIRLIQKCVDSFLSSGFDSLRTVKNVSEHPGKMWRLGNFNQIYPYEVQSKYGPATHAMQYQSLEELYVQTSVLEIAKTSVIPQTGTREGNSILGFITEGIDSHSIDTTEDFDYLRHICSKQSDLLTKIDKSPYSNHKP